MSRFRTSKPLVVLAAALSFALPALPQQPGPMPLGSDPSEAAFKAADTNKDGVLSRDEAAKLPTLAPRFDELDKNKDGVPSFEEFRAGWRGAP